MYRAKRLLSRRILSSISFWVPMFNLWFSFSFSSFKVLLEDCAHLLGTSAQLHRRGALYFRLKDGTEPVTDGTVLEHPHLVTGDDEAGEGAVSYTHLTLPTN